MPRGSCIWANAQLDFLQVDLALIVLPQGTGWAPLSWVSLKAGLVQAHFTVVPSPLPCREHEGMCLGCFPWEPARTPRSTSHSTVGALSLGRAGGVHSLSCCPEPLAVCPGFPVKLWFLQFLFMSLCFWKCDFLYAPVCP